MTKLRRDKRKILYILICLMFSAISAACANTASPITQTTYLFDTIVNITVYNPPNDDILTDCIKLAQHYDSMWNKSNETSDIYKINHSKTKSVNVDNETVDLLMIYFEMYEKSDHVLNPLIGSVSSLWNFKNPLVPDDALIKEALNHTDISNILIDKNTVSLLDPDAQIDIGAIAKGYIADKLKEFLIENGIQSGIINLGGNIMTIGSKPDGNPFTIGIVDPDNTSSYITTVKGNDISVVTSGIYERSFVENNKLYHHILDINSGYPINNDIKSVSIIYNSSSIADALSTTCFILGPDKSKHFLYDYPGIRIIYVMSDRSIIELQK